MEASSASRATSLRACAAMPGSGVAAMRSVARTRGATALRAVTRALLAVAGLAAALAGAAAHAQPPRSARVGVLASSSEANFGPSVKVLGESLRAAGWVEGQNLTLEVRYPGGQYGRLPD